MAEAVQCRGCGRRVVLPASINRARARCPKCRTKIEATVPDPVPRTPDAYQVFSASQAVPVIELPEPEVLSLDDALPPDPKPQPKPPPAPAWYPPPFKFTVRVLSDSRQELSGALIGVLTPHGLFLERDANRPLLWLPPGSRSENRHDELTVAIPGRKLVLQFSGVGDALQLADDTVAFLSGRRPVPLPAEYRRPWWLAGVGAIFALGLATAPVILALREDTSLPQAEALAVTFAVVTAVANAFVGVGTRLPTGLKIAAMSGLSAVLLTVFLVGAQLFLGDDEPPPSSPGGPPAPPPPPSPGPLPPGPPGPPTPVNREPVTNWDFLLRDGVIHLEEGASLVTVVTASPLDGALIAAYADGSTRKWYLDEAAFEPPRLGPRAPSAIRRFEWDAAGTLALITCDTGLVVAPVAPPRPPLFVPGEMAVAYLDSNRDRFAAIRGGRIHVRYLPMDLLKSPMPNRVVGGFITVTPKEETLPLGVMANGFLPPGGVPTFIAWNQGRVITGTADGTITALPAGGGGTAFTSREHKRPVKAWTVSPTGDFAFGDEDGFVGYWPRGGKAIARFKSGAVAVQGLSFSPCGGEVAVVDILGWVSIWDPVKGSKLVEMKQKQPAAAVAYARDDLLMVAAGKGVDVYWLPAMLEP